MTTPCPTCRHFLGSIGYGTICGMHLYGPDSSHCPDHEAGPRYRRELVVRCVEETPPHAVVEAERLARAAQERHRVLWRWKGLIGRLRAKAWDVYCNRERR